jgi:subtilisin family serine protease
MAIPGFRRLFGKSDKRRKFQSRESRRRSLQQQVGRQLAHEPLEARMLLTVSSMPTLIDDLPDNPVLDEGEMLLVSLGPDPNIERPRTTFNVNAADTTNTDQIQPGGILGLNLTGAGLTVGVWDGGAVRGSHQEFAGRVVSGDGAPNLSDHATHVAGTVGASGVNPAAQGMATGIRIRSYDWNDDLAEMTAIASQLVASNHSYGLVTGWSVQFVGALTPSGIVDWWFGDRYLQDTEDASFGKYGPSARDLDQVLHNNPDLLSVWAAGNDRNDAFGNYSTNNQYVAWFSGDPGGIGFDVPGWYLVANAGATTAPPGDGNGGTGYDSLPETQNAKNSLVVGAVLDVLADPYTSADIISTVFSGYGPTDDGRVKPDVVGNGQDLFSTRAGNDAAYGSSSGTSMAAPNVTGTIALLAEHFENRFGMDADGATKKGVAIHTAADAGNRGPDYAYGWGLVNAADAAVFISNAAVGAGGDTIIQGTYTGNSLTYRFASDGTQPIKATLVWMDPPGQVHPAGVLDVRTPVLVHDLDLSITNTAGTVFHPWTLNPEIPSAPAVRTGPNRVDNVEQVLIDSPQLGVYTVRVSDFNGVSNQAFALLVSGANSLDAAGVQPLPPDREIDPIGPQLIAARPNEGHLLLPHAANEELGVAPRELQLLFQGGGNIAPGSDLSQSIRITRQGADGAFDYAYAKTDFYTGAAADERHRVELKIEAVQLGSKENGITVTFTKSDHGSDDRRPIIEVNGRTITVDLNSQQDFETTGRVLEQALNTHPAASRLIRATVTGNTALPLTDNLPRAASVRSDMNTVTSPRLGGFAELEFTAVTAGSAGNDIQLVITKSDHANQSMGPFISVVGKTIYADLNAEDGYRTRAQQLVDAINQHPAAGALVRGRVVAGSLLADLAAVEINYSPLQLQHGHDGNGHPTPLAPLVLSGAGKAEASSSFGVQGLEVGFRAAQPGPESNGVQVAVLASNLGVNTAPRRSASTGRKITVTLNTNTTTPRNTARDLVNAINAHAGARALVQASIVLGDYELGGGATAPAAKEHRCRGAVDIAAGRCGRDHHSGVRGTGRYGQRDHRAVCRDVAGRRVPPGNLRCGRCQSGRPGPAQRRRHSSDT